MAREQRASPDDGPLRRVRCGVRGETPSAPYVRVWRNKPHPRRKRFGKYNRNSRESAGIRESDSSELPKLHHFNLKNSMRHIFKSDAERGRSYLRAPQSGHLHSEG